MKKLIYMFSLAVFLAIQSISAAAQDDNSTQNSPEKENSGPFQDMKVSLVSDFSAVYRSLDNHSFSAMEIPGFIHGHDEEDDQHAHNEPNENRGFNFNYVELAIAGKPHANLNVNFVLHIFESGIEVDEAYFQAVFHHDSLYVKAGKFLSGFGYVNSLHSHNRSMADMPLVYTGIFGCHGLLEKGIQAGYLFKGNPAFNLGAELLQGENELSFGTEGFSNEIHGVDISEAPYPQVGLLYLKSDIETGKIKIRSGLSGAYGITRINEGLEQTLDAENSGANGTKGSSIIIGADMGISYRFDAEKNISFNGEYLHRRLKGKNYLWDGSDLSDNNIIKNQGGFYFHGLISLSEEFGFGAGFDMLNDNRIEIDGRKISEKEKLYRTSIMTVYNPAEDVRFRLQYNYDMSKYLNEKVKPVHEIIVQAVIGIGHHNGTEDDHHNH